MKLFLCLFFLFNITAKESVSVATLEWTPFAGKHLTNYGKSLERITNIFNSIDIDVNYKFLPWARALSSTEEGVYDAIAPIYLDAKRLENFYFSEAIQKTPLVLIVKEKSTIQKYTNIADLSKYIFGLVRGYNNTLEIDKDAKLKKEYSTDDLQNLKKLDSSRVDLVVIDLNVYERLKKLHVFKSNFKVLMPYLDEKSLYVAFPKKNKRAKQLRDKFNEALKKLN